MLSSCTLTITACSSGTNEACESDHESAMSIEIPLANLADAVTPLEAVSACAWL